MSEIDDGGPAFPVIAANGLGHIADGMSLRDWFAGRAMQAMTTSPELMVVVTSGSILDGTAFERLSGHAYRIADAMIAARTPVSR